MSIGLSMAFVNAKSSLNVRQQELNLVSNNVAKANQAGYHRQSAVLADNITILANEGYFGTGVHIATLARNYDTELENSLTLAMNTNGYKEAYADVLSQVEDLLIPEGESGLTDVVSNFTDAIQNLADSPESTTYRTALLSSARNMADRFNQEYENLRKIRDNVAYSKDAADPYAVGGDIADRVETLQGLLERLPQLNNDISRLESNAFLNQKANDLRDERDQIVKEISKYLKVTVTESSDYKYTVTVHDETSGSDLVLVDGTAGATTPDASYLRVSLGGTIPPGDVQFEVYDPNTATSTSLTLEAESGELSALYDARETYVKDQMSQLYSFADAIRQTVNDRLALGEDLDGNAGAAMFTTIAAQPASGTIMSVTGITARQIAASDVDPTVVGLDVEQGNGGNMRSLWDDFNTGMTIGTESDSLSGYSNSFLANISQAVYEASGQATTSANAVTMFQNAIANQSGVNIDQEMTSMLEIQRAYQATAKLISAIESMYDTVFSLK